MNMFPRGFCAPFTINNHVKIKDKFDLKYTYVRFSTETFQFPILLYFLYLNALKEDIQISSQKMIRKSFKNFYFWISMH
jgi:hypothetical protein